MPHTLGVTIQTSAFIFGTLGAKSLLPKALLIVNDVHNRETLIGLGSIALISAVARISIFLFANSAPVCQILCMQSSHWYPKSCLIGSMFFSTSRHNTLIPHLKFISVLFSNGPEFAQELLRVP